MEKTNEQTFGKYLAAKKAALAYGLSESIPDEQVFETAPTNTNLTPASGDIRITMGAGKTHALFLVLRPDLMIFKNLPHIPSTPEASNTDFTVAQTGIAQSDSMATQQSSSAEQQSVEEIISYVQSALSVRYRGRLASRLSELHKSVQEEESDSNGISSKSLQRFIEFLRAYPVLRCPAISITPDRNIYASWKSGSDRVFSVHFLPQGEARFVIFFPNPKHWGQTIRLSGRATVDMIMSVAEPYGIPNWVME